MSTVDPSSARSLPRTPQSEDLGATRSLESTPTLCLDSSKTRPIAPSRQLAAKVARSLRRRSLLAGLFGLFGGWLAAFAIWSYFPAQHTAEIWLQIRPPVRGSSDLEKDETPSAAPIKSPLLLEAALRQPELENLLQKRPQTRPLDWLDQHLTVDTPSQGIIRLTAVSAQADESPLLAEAVVQAFTEEIDRKHQEHLAQVRESYQRTQDILGTQRTALAAVEDPRIAQLETDRQQLRLERKRTQAELSLLSDNGKTPVVVTEADIEAAIKTDAQIQMSEKEIARLTAEIKEFERISAQGASDPAVTRLAQKREEWKKQGAARRLAIAGEVERQAKTKAREEVLAQQRVLELRLAGFDEAEKRFDADEKKLTGTSNRVRTQTLLDDIDAKQETARRLAAEVQALEADAKTGPGVTRLGDTRLFPDGNRNQRIAATVGGGGAMFVFLALFVGLIELTNKRVKAASDLGWITELPVIGALPNLKTPPVAGEAATPGPLAEAIDVLRTLLLGRTGGGPCILLVTSAGAGEGKTMLASHLAASLARAWRKTLLVDGDLRKPAAHKIFNVAQDPGLSDVLRGDVEAADAIQQTALSRLWLLPAGHSDSHALQALAQPDGAAFLDGLREQYEFIVVDSAAVLPVADTLLMSQRVDVVVLAVRCGTSQLPSVRLAQQRLNAMGAPLFGAVVLGAER